MISLYNTSNNKINYEKSKHENQRNNMETIKRIQWNING